MIIVNGVTRSCRLNGGRYIKTTSCCGKLKVVYQNYTIRISKIIDSTYKLANLTYEGEQNIKIFYMKYNVIFFPL